MISKRVILAVVLFLSLAAVVLAKDASAPREVFISHLYGSVTIKRAGEDRFINAEKGMIVDKDDQIKTGRKSYCELAFDRRLLTVVGIKENSELTLGEAMKDVQGISGGAIMPDGRVGLILDVGGVVKMANEVR